MPVIHNQINKLWSKPTYLNFQNSPYVRKIFSTSDAEDFLRTGAYLIHEAYTITNKPLIPWDEKRRYEILANPRFENAFLALGFEYFLKGIYLYKGYAINVPKKGVIFTSQPIQIKNNKTKLIGNKVQDIEYIKNHLPKFIDFTKFDSEQKLEEKNEKQKMKGLRGGSITKLTIPYPTAIQILDYIHNKRNFALHRPFIMPEFRGTTMQQYNLLDYIAYKVTGKKIIELAKLS